MDILTRNSIVYIKLMKKRELEDDLKEMLGNIPDSKIINSLKRNEETNVLLSHELTVIEWKVKLLKFRDIYIIYTYRPDFTDEKNESITITKSEDAANLIFIKERNQMEFIKGRAW
jgi:hypothetical protein